MDAKEWSSSDAACSNAGEEKKEEASGADSSYSAATTDQQPEKAHAPLEATHAAARPIGSPEQELKQPAAAKTPPSNLKQNKAQRTPPSGVSFGNVQVSERKRTIGLGVVPEEGGHWPLGVSEHEVSRACLSVDDYESKKRARAPKAEAFSTLPENERKALFLEHVEDAKDARSLKDDAKAAKKELEKWRKDAAKSTQGCSCSKKAIKGRPTKKKVLQELKKRRVQVPSPQPPFSKLQQLLNDVVEKEPCCTDSCPCVQDGIPCQANACRCWVHLPGDDPPPSAMKAACGNVHGIQVYNEAEVQAHWQKYKTTGEQEAAGGVRAES